MSLKEVVEFSASLMLSLGGGAGIIMAASKWCSNIITEKLLDDIKLKHEKEIESYKKNLLDASSKFNAILNNTMQIAKEQYDTEFKIYVNVWKHLHNITECLDHIDDFKQVVGDNIDQHKEILNSHYNKLNNSLKEFYIEVDSNAPFYQKESYQKLHKIYVLCTMLESIIVKHKDDLDGLSEEEKNKIDSIVSQVKTLKEDLMNEIRTYLELLRNIQ